MTASLAHDVEELTAVSWELERRGVLPPDFGGWMARARSDMSWDYEHFRLMFAELDGMTRGEQLRVLYEIAGRHGKTETVTSYGVYRLERDSTIRILLVTYSQPQARKLSRMMRRLARDRGLAIAPERDSVDEWETTQGGGLRAVGIGSGTASVNADLILIDDPIGNRAEAESAAHRERVWDALTTDILARCEPHTGVLFSMPRWHSDDPVGRMHDRQAGRWQVLRLPGRSEGEDKDPLGRAEGEPLWPEMRGEQWHDAMRVDMGEYGYASFVGCAPRPRSGGMFHWDWWQTLDTVPKAARYVRYWDTAGTAPKDRTHDPDYTAGALLCRMADDRTCIVEVERFRLSVAGRDARLVEIAKKDRAAYGRGITWWFEEESGIAGTERTAAIVKRVQAVGLTCHTERATGSKTLRAEPIASAAEAGNVCLGPGEWRDPFRLEAADFPSGSHDDQIDAVAGAFAKLAAAKPPASAVAFPL